MRALNGGFQSNFIPLRRGLHERLVYEQPRHDVVLAYLIFYLPHEPGCLESLLLLRPLM